MSRAMLVSGIGLLLALAMVNRAASMGLPVSGLGKRGPYLDCSSFSGPPNYPVKLTKADALSEDHWYQFEGWCLVNYLVGSEHKYRWVRTKVYGLWINSKKEAREEIWLLSPPGGSVIGTVTCVADPWLNHSAICSREGFGPTMRHLKFIQPSNGYHPPLTRTLADVARASAVQVPTGQVPNVPGPKVTILSPTQNQVIPDWVKVRVQLPAGVKPADCCNADFWWWHQVIDFPYTDSSKWVHVMSYIGMHSQFTGPNGYSVSRAELAELIKQYGVLAEGGKGAWRVRVGDQWLGYPWGSDWRDFTIGDPQFQILPPQKRP